jgi:DNA-directed RNA polymerase specialized sigma24 family protein
MVRTALSRSKGIIAYAGPAGPLALGARTYGTERNLVSCIGGQRSMPDEITSPREQGGQQRSRKIWQLDRGALDALLETLAPDREAAGARYEQLRRRLIDLFSWENCDSADSLADEVLNRLARKAQERTQIPHLEAFALGIARYVIQEERRKSRNRQTVLREIQLGPKAVGSENGAWDALELCLTQLPAERRDLIERYYIEDRESLARSLGISTNTLRNRAMRIREQLYDCALRERDKS